MEITIKFNFKNKLTKKEKKQVYGLVRSGHVNAYGSFSKFGSGPGIYAIKCLKTNMEYIGSTKNIQLRLGKHFSELNLNRHRNTRLQKDYNEYGHENFEIFVYEYTDKNLLEKEKRYQINKGIKNIYNEKISGYYMTKELRDKHASSDKSTHKTKEYREKMSRLKTNKIRQFSLLMTPIKDWNSCIEIVETLGYTRSVILGCCNGSKSQAYGFLWRYIDDEGNIRNDGYDKGRKFKK